jgi:acyl-CoA thioester hydrolase
MACESAPDEFVDAPINVRYAETDQMGIVYYANYLVWFEIGRVAWCRARGFNYRDMETEEDRLLMVAEASCRYKAPARFDDDLIVRTRVRSATEMVIRFDYEIRHRASGRLLAVGETAHVVADRNLRPARLPERYRGYFPLRRRE